MRHEATGALLFAKHTQTNIAFDLMTGANMRTSAALFRIMSKYSMPYNPVMKKMLELVSLLRYGSLSCIIESLLKLPDNNSVMERCN